MELGVAGGEVPVRGVVAVGAGLLPVAGVVRVVRVVRPTRVLLVTSVVAASGLVTTLREVVVAAEEVGLAVLGRRVEQPAMAPAARVHTASGATREPYRLSRDLARRAG